MILLIALGISAAGDAFLANRWLAAREDAASEHQARIDFIASQKALGEEAAKKAALQQASDKLKKDTADAENAKRIADLNGTIGRLRKQRDSAGAGRLPPAPAGSTRVDLACFDRAEYQRAYGEFVARLRGLADEGTAATVDLDSAKKWAQNPQP